MSNSFRINLPSFEIGAMNVMIAVITAQGDTMNTAVSEENGAVQPTATPKSNQKAASSARRANVTPAKTKSSKKASADKKAPKAPTKASGARDESKAAKMLDLLKRPGGATSKELMKATGWQPHSVRGFLSGTIGKKMGLTVTSANGESGERSYEVKG
jgi:hypothetical protein